MHEEKLDGDYIYRLGVILTKRRPNAVRLLHESGAANELDDADFEVAAELLTRRLGDFPHTVQSGYDSARFVVECMNKDMLHLL